jgi:long-subunit fatty acid transport protein
MSPLLPDADRNDYSLGITYRRSGYEFTVGYMLVDFNERSTVENGQGTNLDGFDGTYDSIAHIPTFGVSKSF